MSVTASEILQVQAAPPGHELAGWTTVKVLGDLDGVRAADVRAGFAQLAAGYGSKHRIPKELLKRAIAHVSWKSHQNGVLSPKAHLRKEVSMETILNAPMIAEPMIAGPVMAGQGTSTCTFTGEPEPEASVDASTDACTGATGVQGHRRAARMEIRTS